MPSARRALPRFVALAACLATVASLPGCSPADPLAEVRRRQAAGDYAGTIEPLRELLSDRRDDLEVHYLYGLALSRTGQVGLAEWSLAEAMKDPEWMQPAGQQLVYNSIASANFAHAIEVATRLLEAKPDDPAVLLLRANAYARSRKHYEESLADVDRILELDPDSADALEPRIVSLLGLERVDEAAEAIGELGRRIEANEVGPQTAGWHCATTSLFAQESGEMERARERWEDCLERFPGHDNVVSNAIGFFDEAGEWSRSLEVLRAAVLAEPASRNYRVQLTNRLRVSGRAEEAEEILLKATEAENPQLESLAWFDLAKHFQDLGEHERSSEAQARALEIARESKLAHTELLFEYADSLLLSGDYEKALAVADEMTLDAHASMIRARVAQERGRHAEALEYFEEAFRLWPNNPFARYHAAIAAEALGDFDRAIEAYRYAIRIAPEATDARTRLGRLLLLEGRNAEALAMLRHMAHVARLDLDGELLSMRAWGRQGQSQSMVQALQRVRTTTPRILGRMAASAALGIAEASGPRAALRFLAEIEGLDASAPENAEALRAVVRYSYGAGLGADAGSLVDRALERHPEFAGFHETRGLWLELAGRDEEARAAYRAALEHDPATAPALVGLARLSPDSEALALCDRALEAAPEDDDVARRVSERLAKLAEVDPGSAEERLEGVLSRHPYEAVAAAALVEVRLAKGAADDRTLELARRAARFGAGIDGLELVARVHRGRGEQERAAEVESRARSLRERQQAVDRGEG